MHCHFRSENVLESLKRIFIKNK